MYAFAAVGAVLVGEATKQKFAYKGKSVPKWCAIAVLLLTDVGGIASTAAVSQAGYSCAKSVWESRIVKK